MDSGRYLGCNTIMNLYLQSCVNIYVYIPERNGACTLRLVFLARSPSTSLRAAAYYYFCSKGHTGPSLVTLVFSSRLAIIQFCPI